MSTKSNEPRMNGQITARQVRLINANGDMVGIVPIQQAMLAAESTGLDLVEISPNAEPPVCKVLDYGKFKYEEQKRAAEARKKQKVVHIKEVKLRPTIDNHDLEIKIRMMQKFLNEGDKVKITLRFRGREMQHKEIGVQLMEKVRITLDELAKIEQHPRFEGQQMLMVLAPAK